MPRSVRNFWIDAQIDGRTANLTGGPRSANGGISMTVKMRNKGDIREPVRIDGWANPDGTLRLTVYVTGQEPIIINAPR